MDCYDLQDEIAPLVFKGELETCIDLVTNELLKLPDSPFHIATELDFTNKPQDIARHFEIFIRKESKRFPIKAIYTETNGFDINPDRWFFDLFAFETHGGHEDFDWLAEWQSEYFDDMTLIGMERLQKVYETEYVGNNRYGDAPDFSSLLVVLKFQKLIKSSAPLISMLNFPILATSHDYEMIYEFSKNA